MRCSPAFPVRKTKNEHRLPLTPITASLGTGIVSPPVGAARRRPEAHNPRSKKSGNVELPDAQTCAHTEVLKFAIIRRDHVQCAYLDAHCQ
jgi:hypothetical protein